MCILDIAGVDRPVFDKEEKTDAFLLQVDGTEDLAEPKAVAKTTGKISKVKKAKQSHRKVKNCSDW
jgi:hypothetical protein